MAARKTTVACLIGDGFEDSEFRVPYDRLGEAGFAVAIIGKEKGQQIEGKQGKERLRAQAGIEEIKVDDYDILFIPGGHSPDHLRADERFVEFVKEFDETGKLVAAICHGPQLLMSARLVQGRTLTAWSTIQDDLELAGANVRDQPVVHDGNWITSRKPDDLDQFVDAIVAYTRGERHAELNA